MRTRSPKTSRTMAELAHAVTGDTGSEMDVLAEGDGPHVLAWRDWVASAEVVTQSGAFETHGVLDALDDVRDPQVPLSRWGAQ